MKLKWAELSEWMKKFWDFDNWPPNKGWLQKDGRIPYMYM